MSTKKISLVVLLIATCLAGTAIYIMNESGNSSATTVDDSEPLEVRSLPRYGISFSYPQTYTLQEVARQEGEVTTFREGVYLYDSQALADAEAAEATEWPPSISISIYDNPALVASEDWGSGMLQYIQADQVVGELNERTVSGRPAFEYQSDGLYMSDNIVFEHEDFLIVISGEWFEEGDQLRRDMARLVSTLELQTPSPER